MVVGLCMGWMVFGAGEGMDTDGWCGSVEALTVCAGCVGCGTLFLTYIVINVLVILNGFMCVVPV